MGKKQLRRKGINVRNVPKGKLLVLLKESCLKNLFLLSLYQVSSFPTFAKWKKMTKKLSSFALVSIWPILNNTQNSVYDKKCFSLTLLRTLFSNLCQIIFIITSMLEKIPFSRS